MRGQIDDFCYRKPRKHESVIQPVGGSGYGWRGFVLPGGSLMTIDLTAASVLSEAG